MLVKNENGPGSFGVSNVEVWKIDINRKLHFIKRIENAGSVKNDIERINLAKQKAKELHVIIVLKGHHTFIATPADRYYFNSTGNAGMATGGTGDVLTGIITGLLAQNYLPEDAAVLGVYLHGLAGDLAAEQISEPALIASDIIDHIGDAYLALHDTL